jgi:hypothetical protein
MIENLVRNHGLDFFIAGIMMTFTGLTLVALMIYLFNVSFTLFRKIWHKRQASTEIGENFSFREDTEKPKEEELAVIAAAIDIYRRLHFDSMPDEMVFERGDPQTPWKMVYKYISRFQRMRSA